MVMKRSGAAETIKAAPKSREIIAQQTAEAVGCQGLCLLGGFVPRHGVLQELFNTLSFRAERCPGRSSTSIASTTRRLCRRARFVTRLITSREPLTEALVTASLRSAAHAPALQHASRLFCHLLVPLT